MTKQPKGTEHIYDVNSPECQHQIKRVRDAVTIWEASIKLLYDLYDNNPFLNEIQPDLMSQCTPVSLDDYWGMLGELQTQWNKLINDKDQD